MKEIFKQKREATKDGLQKARLDALENAQNALHASAALPGAYIALARCHEALDEHEAAIATLRKGIEHCAPSVELYRQCIRFLEEVNDAANAILLAKEARSKFPGKFYFQLAENLLFPMLYSNADEMEFYRDRFAKGLREIVKGLRLDTPEAIENALAGLEHHVNFLLAYQGKDDLDLQSLYGQMAHRIVASKYPQWARAREMPVDEGKLRVGYVSANLCNHSVSKTHITWLLELDRTRFQVFTYHVGKNVDNWTDEARHASVSFRHVPDSIEEMCTAILSDRLHVLVFLDIGMNPRVTQLAALRLAPIQCATWGHPITSGLPTIDYFLSSELMEPVNGQRYYSEKLVCLPGIGVFYRKPFIPRPCFYKSREDFGITNNAVVYLACQSIFKYLPQYDDVFPAIAKLVPDAQFVFIERNEVLRRDFQRRLAHAFSCADVPVTDRLVFVPRLDIFDYWNLNVVSDVYLDTFEWSGCNSTIEAIACKLPVVTLPGRFMRGRHSAAILTQLGVSETIAEDKSHYVQIAAKLGLDRRWRGRIAQSLVDGYPKLFFDSRCIVAMEAFYEEVVRGRMSPDGRCVATV